MIQWEPVIMVISGEARGPCGWPNAIREGHLCWFESSCPLIGAGITYRKSVSLPSPLLRVWHSLAGSPLQSLRRKEDASKSKAS